jgi:DNA helicase-2/ATP-dependent DNA helicase PcrA
MQLSDQQQRAVAYTGSPTLVVAGAGSGKTMTLTAKIDHLVRSGFEPERILAITFTNKAAEEMKIRLVSLTGLPTFKFPWVRTFHSACLRILKAHCGLLGYQPALQVLAEYQQLKTFKEIVIGRLNQDRKHVPAVRAHISHAKNSGNPAAYFLRKPRVGTIRLADAYRLYEQTLKAMNAVDFDNILLLTRDLLRDHPAVRDHYRQLFRYILCDEYQDTNNLQEELTRLLLKDGNLFCVGDDWQAIYSFRGSNVDHFLGFSRTYPGAKVFRLERNFRSADEIVQLANDLIGHNDHKMEKACFSDKRGGVVELHDFFDEEKEADWVARKVQRLNRGGITYDRMAVLYRTRFCSLAFEQTFRKRGIPYRLLGGKGFFERKEVLDLNCYVTAAVFPKDDVAFERILNTPRRGIGPGTVKKLAAMKTGAMSLQDAARQAVAERLLTPKLYHSLTEVLELLDDIRDMQPAAAFQEVITRLQYLDYLKAYTQGNSMDHAAREENIQQLIYSASQKETLLDYLEEAALVKEDKPDDEQASSGAVNLSTIHAAKGLEFGVVFVVGCEEQLFPHWKALEERAGIEEERRLMYVSVTRAERYLYLSSADYRKGQYNRRSRFLNEIAALLG